MSSRNKRNRYLLSESFESLESPFLDEELFAGESDEDWNARLGALGAEVVFLNAFEQAWTHGGDVMSEAARDYGSIYGIPAESDLILEPNDRGEIEDDFPTEEPGIDERLRFENLVDDEQVFEYDIPTLSTVKTDYSLKDIANERWGRLPDDILDAILANGESDVNDLTNRAFWQKHPDLSGTALEPKDKSTKQRALRAEWSNILWRQIRPMIWLRGLIDELDRHRGEIPRDFLLGWIAVESDGKVSTVSTLKERGYFQVMWQGGEARQIGLTLAQFLRLSTDRAFSIEKGVRLAESYRQHFLKRYPSVSDGTDLIWRLTKGRHAYPSALDKVLDALVNTGSSITWQAVAQSLPKLAESVDRTFAYAAKLKPLADRVGAPAAPTQHELEYFDDYDEDVRIFDEATLEADDRFATKVFDVEREVWDDLRVKEAFDLDAVEQVMASGPAWAAHKTSAETAEVEFEGEEQFDQEESWEYDSPQQEQETEDGLGRKLKYLALLPHFVEVKGKNVPLTPGVMDPGIYDGPVKYKIADQLQKCLMDVMGRKEFKHIKVGLVDLTKDVSSPEFAGYYHKRQVFIASVAKIAPLYVAFQMRHDLQTALDQKKSRSLTELFDLVRDDWAATQINPKDKTTPWSLGLSIRGRLVLWHGSPLALSGPKTPRLSNIFANVSAGSPVRVEFKRTGETLAQLWALVEQYHAAGSKVDRARRRLGSAKEKGNPTLEAAATKVLAQAKHDFTAARAKVDALGFEERMRIMIGGDVPISNYMTSTVVGDLGFSYIASALLQSGLYDTNREGGLWLGSRYGGSGWRGALAGGGPQSATTGSLVALMTLMMQDRLVSPAASGEMRTHMQKTPYLNAPGTGSWFESSLRTLNGKGSIRCLLAKVGLADGGADELAFIERGVVDAHGSPKTIRYVVACLRAHDGDQLERLVLELDKCILANNGLTPSQGGHP